MEVTKLKDLDPTYLSWIHDNYDFPNWHAALECRIRTDYVDPSASAFYNWYKGITINLAVHPNGFSYSDMKFQETFFHELKHLEQRQKRGLLMYLLNVFWEQRVQRRPWAEQTLEMEAEEWEAYAVVKYREDNPLELSSLG